MRFLTYLVPSPGGHGESPSDERSAEASEHDDAGASPRTSQKEPPRLVLRFALFTAIGFAVAAACILLVVRHLATEQAERSAMTHARLMTQAILGHNLELGDFSDPVTGSRRAELDELIQDQLLLEGALLVTLFGEDATVTYSNDHSLIGRPASNRARIEQARAGTIVSDVTSTDVLGARGSDLELLSAYVPVALKGSTAPGVVALYQDYAPIKDAAKAAFFPVAATLQALLFLLFIALVPIMARVTARVRSQMREIEHQAFHDELTGLPNRALFRDRAEQATLAARRDGSQVGVVLIDLDRFKEVNDTLGHRSGDLLLQDLGDRLRSILREGETLARLGGDEFGVVLPRVSDEGIKAVAERIQAALQEPFALRGLSIIVEASIGIAAYPGHGDDVDTLIRRADIAMYVAKEGRTGYALYDAEHDSNDADRLSLLGELRRAIDEQELVLYYQPKANLANGEICGVEALVRWQHPERGLLMPGEFLPLAERTGLIKPLSRYVLEMALRQCKEWSDGGIELDVAVNLAMADLLDLDLPDSAEELIAQSGLEHERLVLEITESTIMADPFRARQVLVRLSEMGVRLAIDDFGTGYSSLAYLKRLPVDQLKIDRSFVMNMTRDRNDAAIVRSTADLGRNLGLEIVAEGVESEEIWEELRALGCDLAQGYYVSKPVPASDLPPLLDRGGPSVVVRQPARRSATRQPDVRESDGAIG